MSKGKRVIEWLKNLLIVLLLCSAVGLLADSQLFGHLPWTLEPQPTEVTEQLPAPTTGQVTLPMAIAVTNASGMCATRYDAAAIDELFQLLQPILSEAVAGAGKPEPAQPEQWYAAMTAPNSIWLELQGNVPLQVLCRWLADTDDPALTGSARQLLLCVEQEQVRLYYRDGADACYTCPVDGVTIDRVQAALVRAVPNGAEVAGEREEYSMLPPQTLILPDTPEPVGYTAYNPLEGETDLDVLLQSLSFAPGIVTMYQGPEGWRVRGEHDMLSISNEGQLDYERDGEEPRYPLAGMEGDSEVYRAAEPARQMVCGTVQRWGGTSVYLLDARQEGGSWCVEFGYVLNGIAVQLGERKACASVWVDRQGVVRYEMTLRGYRPEEQTTLLLPQAQAAAVLEQMGQADRGLLLGYLDNGNEVRAGWLIDR